MGQAAAENLSGRPCKRQPVPGTTPSDPLETFSCTIVRSTMLNVVKQERHVKGDGKYANPDKHDNDADGTNERRFG